MQEAETTSEKEKDPALELSLPQDNFTANGILACTMIAVFLACIGIPPIYQYYYDTHVVGWWELKDLLAHAPTASNLKEFENTLSTNSRLSHWVRHTLGFMQGAKIGDPLPSPVLKGSDGFLFYRGETDKYHTFSLLDPPPAPTANIVHAILDYDLQAKQRGIHLVVMPVPMKSTIYPDKLWPEYQLAAGPAYPPSFMEWLDRLHSAGVDVLNLAPILWNARQDHTELLYLKDDNHWTWLGRSIASDTLADHIRPFLAACPGIQFDIVRSDAVQTHDLTRMLDTSEIQTAGADTFSPADCVYLNGKPFQAGDDAPALVLGDSFSLLGADSGHGLQHELMMRLHVGVQAVERLGFGASWTREELQRHPENLKNKKVIIWEFATPTLWDSSFLDVPLPPPVPANSTVIKSPNH